MDLTPASPESDSSLRLTSQLTWRDLRAFVLRADEQASDDDVVEWTMTDGGPVLRWSDSAA